jgi:hypothetical protein
MERRFKFRPSWLILRHALRLNSPDWEIEPTKVEPICGENRRPVWFRLVREHALDGRGRAIPNSWREYERAEGVSPKTRRPYPDAYLKYELASDPHFGIIDRMRYEVWRSALDFLVADLAGKLDLIELTPSRRKARPSEPGNEDSPAIWRDISATRAPRPIGKPSVITPPPLSRRPKRRAEVSAV